MRDLYRYTRTLIDSGDSEFDVQEKLGLPDRRCAAMLVRLAQMPQFIQNEYELLIEQPERTFVTWNQLPRLYTAYSTEYVEYPQGNGPGLMRVWHEVLGGITDN